MLVVVDSSVYDNENDVAQWPVLRSAEYLCEGYDNRGRGAGDGSRRRQAAGNADGDALTDGSTRVIEERRKEGRKEGTSFA